MSNILEPGKAANLHFVLKPSQGPYFSDFEGDFFDVVRRAFWPHLGSGQSYEYPWRFDSPLELLSGADIVLVVRNMSSEPQPVPDVLLLVAGSSGEVNAEIPCSKIDLLR